jgi:putative ABC transport system permease protein
VAGRLFSGADSPTSLRTVIVNRALADRFFPGASPLGTRIRIGPNPRAAWRTIVGVVGDMRQSGPEMPPAPELYLPAAQDTFADLSIVVRTTGDPLALAGSLRAVVSSLDPQLPVIEMRTLEAMVGERVASRRLLMILLGGFAALALGLSLIGVYGVMAYAVAQRTREIGVRMALGARRGDIVRAVLGDGSRLAGAGLVAGIALSLVATRALRGVLFGVTPTDPTTFAAVAAGMLTVALLACYLPARRAARVDPLAAIRAE